MIGALERLRLDLMRLKAGEGSPEQVSAAIDAAVRINQETGTRRVPTGLIRLADVYVPWHFMAIGAVAKW